MRKFSLAFCSFVLISLTACSGMQGSRKPSSEQDPHKICNISWDSITKINAPTDRDNDWFKKPVGTFYAEVNGKKIPLMSPAPAHLDHVGFSYQCDRDKNAAYCSISIHLTNPAQRCVCEAGKCVSACEDSPRNCY
jgi:hypothetical protein